MPAKLLVSGTNCSVVTTLLPFLPSLFSKEQYFDPNGFFIFMVFSGPIILNCFLIVVCCCPAWWFVLVLTLYPFPEAVLAVEGVAHDGEGGADED